VPFLQQESATAHALNNLYPVYKLFGDRIIRGDGGLHVRHI